MRKRSNIRLANGVASAIIVCFFSVHGLFGSFAPTLALANSLGWLAWAGVGVVALHVVLSVATSREQLTDAEFPPSKRKKRHLALKWATGIALAAAAGVHIACMRAPSLFADARMASALAIVVLAIALAVHVCVGAKSLLKDVGLSKGLIMPLRAAICVLAAVFAVAALAALVL